MTIYFKVMVDDTDAEKIKDYFGGKMKKIKLNLPPDGEIITVDINHLKKESGLTVETLIQILNASFK